MNRIFFPAPENSRIWRCACSNIFVFTRWYLRCSFFYWRQSRIYHILLLLIGLDYIRAIFTRLIRSFLRKWNPSIELGTWDADWLFLGMLLFDCGCIDAFGPFVEKFTKLCEGRNSNNFLLFNLLSIFGQICTRIRCRYETTLLGTGLLWILRWQRLLDLDLSWGHFQQALQRLLQFFTMMLFNRWYF